MTRGTTIYEGNLTIRNAEDAKKYAGLTKVTGSLSINSSAKLDALKSVGGSLSINSSAKLDALKSVGGDLSINSSAKLDALKSVGGYLYINSGAELTANKLYTGGYSKFTVHDHIGAVVLSSKQKGGVTILCCRQPKIRNQKVVGDKFFVAQKGGQNAHGKTIEEALREIQFKTGERDVSEYRNMPKDSKKAPDEWAFIYRIVTGACQYGTQKFIEAQGKLKKAYTLTEILKLTSGQHGHEKFRSVVEGR